MEEGQDAALAQLALGPIWTAAILPNSRKSPRCFGREWDRRETGADRQSRENTGQRAATGGGFRSAAAAISGTPASFRIEQASPTMDRSRHCSAEVAGYAARPTIGMPSGRTRAPRHHGTNGRRRQRAHDQTAAQLAESAQASASAPAESKPPPSKRTTGLRQPECFWAVRMIAEARAPMKRRRRNRSAIRRTIPSTRQPCGRTTCA